jgi:hypothetical protein
VARPAQRREVVDIQDLRRHRDVVLRLARQHGLTNIRISTTGRLLVSVANNRTYVDVANFDAAVEESVGVVVDSIPDGVLAQGSHPEDLDDVTPL